VMPLSLAAHGQPAGLVGTFAAVLSAATLTLQAPIAHWANRLGRRRAVRDSLIVAGFACLIAWFGDAVAIAEPVRFALMLSAVAGIGVAMMLGNPAAQSLASDGPSWQRATRMGALASAGGLAALTMSAITGRVVAQFGTSSAWAVASVLPFICSLFLNRMTWPDTTSALGAGLYNAPQERIHP
jgi:MFS family permease